VATAPPPSKRPATSPVVSDSERLAPYVPSVAIEWLRETPEARYNISGFTALTERLSRKGKVGAEEMNDLLDSIIYVRVNDCSSSAQASGSPSASDQRHRS
jgi:hypothetical protein